jgi:branched-chain amino acid transport system permease protein
MTFTSYNNATVEGGVMAYFVQQLLNAIPIAALYAVLAFGYTIVFSLTRRADVTYGAIFAFAGQTYLLFADFGWNQLWLILPATLAFGATFALSAGLWAGVVVGRTIIRPLVKASPNAVMVAGLGVLIALMEGVRLAANTRVLWLPPLFQGPIVLFSYQGFSLTVTAVQLFNTVVFLCLIALINYYLRVSTFGRQWRAVANDAFAAELCGVNSGRILLLSYCLAACLAAIAAIFATSYYGNMDFGAGLTFGLKIVLISAAGGYSSPLSSAYGAASIGVAETLWGGYGPVMWRDAAVLLGLVVWLVIRRSETQRP